MDMWVQLRDEGALMRMVAPDTVDQVANDCGYVLRFGRLDATEFA